MVLSLYTGLTHSLGAVPWPWAAFANAVLLVQFPLLHSFLLTDYGRGWLERLGLFGEGQRLATTTYVIIASLQLLVLFALWTPTGIVVFRAEGGCFWAMTAMFAASWLLLAKASFDAGPGLQSGWIGWVALLKDRAPRFPDMPETGLFKLIRQPIYFAFAMALWTPPVWTVDQLIIAAAYTVYCLLGPLLKERRFRRFYGDRFTDYQARVAYWIPGLKNRR